MFKFIRVIFLTLVTAYRPVLARPRVLSELVVAPVLVATLVILGVIPFAQRAILIAVELQPSQVLTVDEQLTHRLLVFTAEMLALIPWLWLASVLMMNWPRFRHLGDRAQSVRPLILHRKVWKSTAVMIGACILLALPLEALDLWGYYHAEMMASDGIPSTGFLIKDTGSEVDAVLFLTLILLSRYSLVLHGISIGRRITVRESWRRLSGRSLRLFFTCLLIIGAAHQIYSPFASDAGWGGGPMMLVRADDLGVIAQPLYSLNFVIFEQSWGGSPIQLLSPDVPGPLTNAFFVFTGYYIVDVFVFALAICAISEVIARANAATRAEVPEPQAQPIQASI